MLLGFMVIQIVNLTICTLFSVGRIGRTYSEKCLDILTGLLGLKQEHITSGKKGYIRLNNTVNFSSKYKCVVYCKLLI